MTTIEFEVTQDTAELLEQIREKYPDMTAAEFITMLIQKGLAAADSTER